MSRSQLPARHPADGPGTPPIDLEAHPIGGFGLDLAARDPAVRPGDDFFMSVNGTWYAKAVIPPTFTAAGAWFELRIKAVWREQAILEAAATGAAPRGSAEEKIGAFYRAFLDDAKVESRGLTPLRPALDAIRSARSRSQIARLMGQIAGPGTVRAFNTIGPPPGRGVFSVDVGQDPDAPTRHAVLLGTPGVMLPNPSFYLDPKLADMKQAYETHLARMLGLVGWANAEDDAKQIVAFETRVARALALADEPSGDQKPARITIAELGRAAPGFDWRAYMDGAELASVPAVWVDSRDATTRVAAIVAETPVPVLQARLAFATAAARAQALPRAIRQADFELRTLTLNGKGTAPPPRERIAALSIEANMGQALGALYARKYSSPAAKALATEMVANLRAAMGERIDNAAWLSAETKARAHAKLDRIAIKIAYPDHYDDFAGLAISDRDLYGDMVRGAEYNWRRLTQRVDQPVDRSDWGQTFPQNVNVMADGALNDVIYPAGLLQPPFLDPNADPAVNYGGVGAFMASSIASLLNDHHHDANGRAVEWFSPDEVATFGREARKLSAQYSEFEPLPGLHLNGDQVLGGSLYDLGGLVVALAAYHRSLGGRSAPVIEGLSGDQRFFMSWAQFWRLRFRPEFIRNQVATDPNSPAIQRANGPERNMDEWYAAFNVQPGDKLYVAPENRVRIW